MWRRFLPAGILVGLALFISSGAAFADSSVVQGALPISHIPGSALMQQDNIFWYLSRTAAMVAYILLFLSILMGIGLKLKDLDRVLKRWQSFELHKFISLLAIAFVGLHIFSLLGDSYFSFGVKELLVPFASPYQPDWTAVGVFSFYVMLVVTFSWYARRAIGERAWRVLHRLSFPLFFAILVHGVRNGSDTAAIWAQVLYVSTGTAVTVFFIRRFLASRFSGAKQPERDESLETATTRTDEV